MIPIYGNANELSGEEYKSLKEILIFICSNILLAPS